jgi:hypothetical protein
MGTPNTRDLSFSLSRASLSIAGIFFFVSTQDSSARVSRVRYSGDLKRLFFILERFLLEKIWMGFPVRGFS